MEEYIKEVLENCTDIDYVGEDEEPVADFNRHEASIQLASDFRAFMEWVVNTDQNPFARVFTGEFKDVQYVNFIEGSERKYTIDELFNHWLNIRKK